MKLLHLHLRRFLPLLPAASCLLGSAVIVPAAVAADQSGALQEPRPARWGERTREPGMHGTAAREDARPTRRLMVPMRGQETAEDLQERPPLVTSFALRAQGGDFIRRWLVLGPLGTEPGRTNVSGTGA